VDYLSIALGDSSTYRGSTGIVPPPPVEESAIAGFAAPFRVGPPLIATSRIVDPDAADRLIADGVADAVGMTRALITDPDLPRKAADGRAEDVLRCIGCNVCIAHYHAAIPIACAQNPRTGRELTWAPVRAARQRVAVVGGGPAGMAAAACRFAMLRRHARPAPIPPSPSGQGPRTGDVWAHPRERRPGVGTAVG